MASYLKYVFCLLLASSVSALVHPGMLHTDDDFTRMQSKVDASATPWIIGWDLLIANSHSQPTYTANPLPIVYRGSDGVHAENYGTLYNDVAAAYALALRWKIQDDDEFADAAVAIFVTNPFLCCLALLFRLPSVPSPQLLLSTEKIILIWYRMHGHPH